MTLKKFAAVAGGVVPLLLLASCEDTQLTQVVLVVQSDLAVPAEVDGMDVTAINGPFAPPVSPFISNFGTSLGQFPLSVGFMSRGGTEGFSVVARLFKGALTTPMPALVVSRTVTDVRFVDQQTMMLVLPMMRACACQGTSCPTGSGCDNIDRPALQAFDAGVAPPSTMMGINVGGGGGGGGPVPARAPSTGAP
jgi:hypothetical protein